jgi:hypothetical protein
MAFATMVVATIMAVRSFDPRLVWDAMDSMPGLRPGMERGSLRGDEERPTGAGGPPSVILEPGNG